jgi:hypothetical protein
MVLVLSAGLQLAKKMAMIQANERRYLCEGLEIIDSEAFEDCSSLGRIIIPSTVN